MSNPNPLRLVAVVFIFCTAIGALSTFALLDSPEEMILFAALGALLSGLFWGTLMSTGSDSSKDGNLLRRSLCVGLLAACLTLTIPAITYVCYLVASADFCEPDQAFECLPEDYIEADFEAGVCI